MPPDLLWKFLFLITDLALAGALSWLVFLFNACQKNKEEMAALRLHMAENYAKKDDIHKQLERLEEKLDQLFKDLHATAKP